MSPLQWVCPHLHSWIPSCAAPLGNHNRCVFIISWCEALQVKISQKLSGHQEQTFHLLCMIRKSLLWSHASKVTCEPSERFSRHTSTPSTRTTHIHASTSRPEATEMLLILDSDWTLNSNGIASFEDDPRAKTVDVKVRKAFKRYWLPRMHLQSKHKWVLRQISPTRVNLIFFFGISD